MISNYVMDTGKANALSCPDVIKTVFILGTSTKIVGVNVHCYRTEGELLMAWRDFIVAVGRVLYFRNLKLRRPIPI